MIKFEFEIPDRQTVALQDSDGFTTFPQEVRAPVGALWFQVADVDAVFAEWSGRGVAFARGPRKSYRGYRTELRDPETHDADGYLIRLWDERSMRESSS